MDDIITCTDVTTHDHIKASSFFCPPPDTPHHMLHTIIRGRNALSIPLRRTFYASSILRNAAAKHTADSYNKDDIDPTPPSDSSVYRVDSSSDAVQKPHEAPSGEWSRAGTKTSEYQSKSKTEPYVAPAEQLKGGEKEGGAKE
ncbi:hypothetical protein H0H92_004570, partial [Tricholoma furcatifolium]